MEICRGHSWKAKKRKTLWERSGKVTRQSCVARCLRLSTTALCHRGGSVGISALRDVVRLQVPEIWQAQYAKAIGAAGVRKLTADDLSALLYAAAWCRAYGRDISEYLATFGATGAREV